MGDPIPTDFSKNKILLCYLDLDSLWMSTPLCLVLLIKIDSFGNKKVLTFKNNTASDTLPTFVTNSILLISQTIPPIEKNKEESNVSCSHKNYPKHWNFSIRLNYA